MNKLIKSLLFVVLSTTAVFATESAPTDNVSKPVATADAKSSKLSDASADFLRFALAKAEKYSGKVEDAIGKGVDLAVQEAPETARQWITWRAWYHGLHFGLPVALFCAGVIVVMCNYRKAFSNDDFTANAFLTIVGSILSFVSGLIAICDISHLFSLVQIWVAPRIYMIEELVKLIK